MGKNKLKSIHHRIMFYPSLKHNVHQLLRLQS